MKRFFRGVGYASDGLAVLCKLVLAALVVLIVADVVVRNLGLRPIYWATTTAEYGLLYVCFLAMPALTRGKGHVFVEFLRQAMPTGVQKLLEKAVYLLCIGMCSYLAWTATAGLANAVAEGAYEARTFDMPKWLVYLPMALGFWLSALEWLRFLFGEDSLYDVDVLEMEGF